MELFYRLLCFHNILDEKVLFEINYDEWEKSTFLLKEKYNPIDEFNILLKYLDENLINKLSDENKKILQSYNKDSHTLDNIVQDLTKIDNEVKKLFNDEKLTVQCFNFLSTYYYNKGKF